MATDPRKADPQNDTKEASELRAIHETDSRKSVPGSLVLALVLTLVLALVLTLVLALVLTLVLGQDQEPSICVIGVSLLQQSAPHLEQGVTRGQEVS